MASNSFGQILKITTWGESHGKAIGVVIDGMPAGITLSETDINTALEQRAPGRNTYTSPRKEPDLAEIYSGVFEGKTTGAPISIVILNKDHDSSQYDSLKALMRPGHANYTYLQKYGNFDYRGGGRSSARETACRVAAAAVADRLLEHYGVEVFAYLAMVAEIAGEEIAQKHMTQAAILADPLFCPDPIQSKAMQAAIAKAKEAGDSLGGVVAVCVPELPIGLGDPIYEKLEANLAKAMLSIPASKGFEIGEGFAAAKMSGSVHNDAFVDLEVGKAMLTNHAGGTLGGISTGMPLLFRVAFKPTSSIKKTQKTVDLSGKETTIALPENARHDPCVAVRAVPVVAAMCKLVLADALLMNRLVRLR